ncbi:MAG: hypothetical protein JW795_07305 [Chitinivibrionales bacterium]|nr:hypothetical protein [Chitinivibrionales bacterium]
MKSTQPGVSLLLYVALSISIFSTQLHASEIEKSIKLHLNTLDTAVSSLATTAPHGKGFRPFYKNCLAVMKKYPEITTITHYSVTNQVVTINRRGADYKLGYLKKNVRTLEWSKKIFGARKPYYGKLYENETYSLFWVKPFADESKKSNGLNAALAVTIHLTKTLQQARTLYDLPEFEVYAGNRIVFPTGGVRSGTKPAIKQFKLFGFNDLTIADRLTASPLTPGVAAGAQTPSSEESTLQPVKKARSPLEEQPPEQSLQNMPPAQTVAQVPSEASNKKQPVPAQSVHNQKTTSARLPAVQFPPLPHGTFGISYFGVVTAAVMCLIMCVFSFVALRRKVAANQLYYEKRYPLCFYLTSYVSKNTKRS